MEALTIAIPAAVICLFFVVSMDFVLALSYAREYNRKYDPNSHYHWMSIGAHRALMKSNVYKVVLGVLLIEGFVRIVGGDYSSGLFIIHLVFAVPFLISLLVLAFRLNGFRSPNTHRVLGYFCLAFFVGVLVTGVPLMFELIRHSPLN